MENLDIENINEKEGTKEIYNANQDGTIELGDAIKSKTPKEIKDILEKSLKANNWEVTYLDKNKGMYKYIVKKGEIEIKLNVYIANISWASRSNPEEYRRQLASDISRIGFEAIESKQEYTLLLGIYDKDKPVFVGWDKNNKDNNGKQNSIYVNISMIAEALRDGFSINHDEKNHIVCAFVPEFMHFYVKYKNKIHSNKGFLDECSTIEYELSEEGLDYGSEQFKESDLELEEYTIEHINDIAMKRNRIISGAPGTGKSNRLDKDSRILKFEETKRVTFYPTYGYGQFIGTYKPYPIYSCPSTIEETLYEANGIDEIKEYRKPIIDYKLVKGPFLDMLCKAINNRENKYLLIIEEINRGDASSIFGDTFQLLDRNSKGESTYGIRFNEDIMNHIAKEGILYDQIKIPSNMYIWCTMNSADEGVKKLDSAFKRRWNFEYMHINGDENSREYIESLEIKTKFNCLKDVSADKTIKWDDFRQKLNTMLLEKTNIPEDKLIGPFFISKEEMNDENALVDKLVMYLREDVLRYKASEFFGEKSFFQILDSYKKGENIFSKVISDKEFIDMVVNKIENLEGEKLKDIYENSDEDNENDLEGQSND